MAWQLIYTSAEHGLTAGRSGFCIVARHVDIRERLVAELERLSVFDRPPAGQPLPVIRTHRILTVGSDCYHILSCIQDAGPDYSGRTNHIAHHLICEEYELTAAASPALILRGFPWRKQWDEPARYFDDNELVDLSSFHQSVPSGSSWKQVAGNAAHARLLIEPKARAGCYVAYSPGDDDHLLLLFHESLGRLADRVGQLGFWQISFTTMWQVTDNPPDFAWRGCWAGSAAHREAETVSATVFDLKHPGSLPTPAPLELLKDATKQATPAQPAIKVTVQRTDKSQRKSTSRKVDVSYEGLSEEERQQQLMAQIPVELAARREWKRRLNLFLRGVVVIVFLVGILSVCIVRRHSTVAIDGKHINTLSIASQSTSAPPLRSEGPQTLMRVQQGQPTPPPPSPTEPVAPAPPPTPLLSETNQLPKVPTFFKIGQLRSGGVDVSGIITGKLPGRCFATFIQSGSTNFPADAGTDVLDIVTEENKVTWFRQITHDKLKIENNKLSFTDTTYQHVALWFEQNQIILLDTYILKAAPAPFLPLQFGTNCLDIAADGRKIQVKDALVKQLQYCFPNSSLRLVTKEGIVSELPSIDLSGIQSKLEATNKVLQDDINQLEKKRTDADLSLMTLLTRDLGQLNTLLDKAGVPLVEPKKGEPPDGTFTSQNQDADGLWKDYIGFLKRVLGRIEGSLSLTPSALQNCVPNKLSDVPGELNQQYYMLPQVNKDELHRQRITGVGQTWGVVFTKERIDRLNELLSRVATLDTSRQQKLADKSTAETELGNVQQSAVSPNQLRIEIEVATKYWWRLIEFKDNP